MRITKLDAIKSLCPTVELTVEGDSTITFWSDDSVAKPTDSQITTEQARLQSIEDWKETRVVGTATTSGYDLVTNQLDQLYHDMTDGKLGVAATTGSWYVGITSVKDAFPKPS